MLSPEYAAGFFDGEGCVNITVRGRCRQVCLRVMLVNTDAEILSLFYAQWGGRLTRPRVHRDTWKPFRALIWSGQEAIDFLTVIQPYCRVKQRQIALAQEFWAFMKAPRMERCAVDPGSTTRAPFRVIVRRTPATLDKELLFKQQMHALNRKGAA